MQEGHRGPIDTQSIKANWGIIEICQLRLASWKPVVSERNRLDGQSVTDNRFVMVKKP